MSVKTFFGVVYRSCELDFMLFTFVSGLLNVAVVISDCIATNDGMIKDSESTVFGTNRSCPNLRQ